MRKFVVPYHELSFEAARSSGAGGQSVNRTESAVALRWNVATSPSLDEDTRQKVLRRLHNWITQDGDILIKSQEHRSQKMNKDACVEKLVALMERAFIEPKKRIKTKPTKGSQRRRVDEKKNRSEIKQGRQKVRL